MNLRYAALLVLWVGVLGLWALVFFRQPAHSPTAHLPAVGGAPPSVPAVPPTTQPARQPAIGAGSGAATNAQARQANVASGSQVDAEDIAEGDVEDEPQATALGGSTASISAASGSAGSTLGVVSGHAPSVPAVPVPTPPIP